MPGRTLISLLVCVFALTLAGCGGDDDGTIPPDDAENLLNQVDAVQEAIDENNCELAEDHAQELIATVNSLPGDVDREVASELTKASDNLRAMTSDPDECTTGASGVTGVQPTEPETTEPDTTETETTVTETTAPEEETTTEEAPEEPPEEPAGGDQGGGAGGNQGGGNVSPPPTGGAPSPSGGLEPPTGGGNG